MPIIEKVPGSQGAQIREILLYLYVYTNDNELARFNEEDVTPFIIKPIRCHCTVISVKLIEVNGYFSFDNFTLTARVGDFPPLQGQNLTCGTHRIELLVHLVHS